MKLLNVVFNKKNVKWFLLGLTLISFLFIAKSVYLKEIIHFDVIVYKYIAELRSPFVTLVVSSLTNLGGWIFLVALSIFMFIIMYSKRIGLFIIINLLTSSGFNLLIKFVIARPRPMEYPLIEETGYSFPSGHSMVSMAFYGFIVYLIYKNVTSKILKWLLIVTISIGILLIGLSRIYLGVHYTSDVLAGFFLGIFYLIIYISVTNHILMKNK